MKQCTDKPGTFIAPTTDIHNIHNSPALDALLVQAVNYALSYGSSTIIHHIRQHLSSFPIESTLLAMTKYYTKNIGILHIPGRRLLTIEISTQDKKNIFVKLE